MADVIEKLGAQIDLGKITFDSDGLRDELLGTNLGTKVSSKIQSLVLELSYLVSSIRISSVVRGSGHHGSGRAVDLGDESIAPSLLPKVVGRVAQWEIDEIIFDAGGTTLKERNRWNYDAGKPHEFDATTLGRHADHIHFAVAAD
jgi:hypothetical protein